MQIWIQPQYFPGINWSHVLPLSVQMIAGIGSNPSTGAFNYLVAGKRVTIITLQSILMITGLEVLNPLMLLPGIRRDCQVLGVSSWVCR